MAIADRVDEVATILDVAPDDALTQAQYDTMRTAEAVLSLLETSASTRRFAEGQLSFWESVASRVSDGARALLVTHGGNIELPAVMLAARMGAAIGPLPLSYGEGVRVRYDQGRAVAVERLRAD